MIQEIHPDYNRAFQEALKKLNPAQLRAVEHIDGPVLVVAGPGTGKTQIIAARIGNILSKTDTQPQNILCLTYTDAGTIAMRQRLLQFIGPTAYRVNIYTFHAFCNEVIQSHPDYFGKRTMELISELENISLLETMQDELPQNHLLKRLKGEIYSDVSRLSAFFQMMKNENWSVENVLRAIDHYLADLPNREEFRYKRGNSKKGIKQGDIKQADIDNEKSKMEKLRAAAELFPVYRQKMLDMNRYDYSDMIMWVVKAFSENEDMLRRYQERYLYFLVDEFQDTNGSQNEILKQLISYWDKPNCFAVGDDDQGIYEFQGARVKNIMDFHEANKKDIETIVLTENYRSNQQILDASKVLIDHNQERLIHKIKGLDKTLKASHAQRMNSTVAPEIIEYPNVAQEEAGILKQIQSLHEQGFPLGDVAVIYYRHAQAENLIQFMKKKSIPYQVKKEINILDVPLIQNVLTILRYVDAESKKAFSGEHFLFEMMYYHFFEIHPHDIVAIAGFLSSKRIHNKWREVLSDRNMLLQIRLKNPEALERFEKNITHWISNSSNLTLQMLFEEILNEGGLLKYILQSDEKFWLMEVVTTFFNFLKSEGMKKPRLKINELLEMIDQMETHKIRLPVSKIIFSEQGVNFITAHSAKGLEFQYVFLIGCTSDKWESAQKGGRNFSLPDTLTFTKEENKMESLRRLFYVAMTRAKEHLHISYAATSNDGKALEKSQFITEVLEGTGLKVQPQILLPEELFTIGISALQNSEKPVVELQDIEFIRKKLEHITLSATALNNYLRCPLSYYYDNILSVPTAKNDSMAFGSAIHNSLNRLFKKMQESADKEFQPGEKLVEDFVSEMKRHRDSFTDKQFENRIALGKQLLADFYGKYVKTWNKIVLTEHRIQNVEVDGVPIKGVFDKIEFTGNDVNVVDYKTGSVKWALSKLQPPSEKNPEGGDYWRQIIFYKILMDNSSNKQWNMVSGEIDFLEKDESKNEFVKRRIEINKEAIDIVKEQIKTSYTKIMNLEFTEGCGDDGCYWCSFVKRNNIAQPSLPIPEVIK